MTEQYIAVFSDLEAGCPMEINGKIYNSIDETIDFILDYLDKQGLDLSLREKEIIANDLATETDVEYAPLQFCQILELPSV